MLKINGKVWYKPLVNSCYVNDLSDFAGDATENECVLGDINWVWYHYPTLEEALEGLKKRSPEDYESSSWCISEMSEERYGIHHWAYRLHK